MKKRAIFILLIHLNLIIIHGQNLKWQNIMVYGNYGIPVGLTQYSNSDYSDNKAALFSNMKYYLSMGADLTIGYGNRWGFGLSINYGSFGNWTNDKSTRFKESKLTNLDIGPLITFNLSTANQNRISRLIFSPLFTNMKLVNPNDNYEILVSSSKEGLAMNEEVNVPETFQRENLWSPGIYLGEETIFLLDERFLFFFRLGLKTNYAKSNAFPDKFLLNPNISVGWGLNLTRDKWFFLK